MAEFFDQAVFLKFLAAVLAIFNPLYNMPIFLSMTRGCSAPERRRVALIVMTSVTVIALTAVLIGEEILAVFGIDVPSFRIAGGIIIFGIGMSMLNAEDRPPGDQAAVADGHERKFNFAVVPLAIPLTIGPGTIAITIVFSHQATPGTEIVTLGSAVVIACSIVGLGLLFADQISRFLGDTMINVLTRIMAILLVAVAVEMVLTGVFNAIDMHYPGLTTGQGAQG
ncbi:MarC family protein [uncultured Ruegeria sp.]|jgi:multiple antibiotic resistance protein|uniref:MarC family protein n=1 Tax=uncultured Ruegeria sp. TaxID=259304 RepID=UPI00261FF788|nr:MarC family protein [uncultured Ruegeria sp.]